MRCSLRGREGWRLQVHRKVGRLTDRHSVSRSISTCTLPQILSLSHSGVEGAGDVRPLRLIVCAPRTTESVQTAGNVGSGPLRKWLSPPPVVISMGRKLSCARARWGRESLCALVGARITAMGLAVGDVAFSGGVE